MERRRLIINFKNNPEEIALYEKIKNHSSISGYVKDILRGLVKEDNSSNKQQEKATNSNDLDENINNIVNNV